VDTQGGGCDAAAALAARGQSAVKDTREVDNGRTDHAVKKRWANLERSSGERRAAAIMRLYPRGVIEQQNPPEVMDELNGSIYHMYPIAD